MRAAPWVLITMLLATPVAQADAIDGDGIQLPAHADAWPRWQGRLTLGTDHAPGYWRSGTTAAGGSATHLTALSLLGDYYLALSPRAGGQVGGFRATSGLVAGLGTSSTVPWGLSVPGQAGGRHMSVASFSVQKFAPVASGSGATGLAVNAGEPRVLPYLGLGYTGLSSHGGWGFSADIGLLALQPGHAVKLGRVFSGTQSVDDLLRDLRLSPVLQLGVSYSF